MPTEQDRAMERSARKELYGKIFRGEGPLPNAMRLMKIAFENNFDDSAQRTFDVFVHYHWADRAWVCDTLLPRLQGELGMSVKSEDDIDVGDVLIMELINCIDQCNQLILTLSADYIADNACKHFSTQAYCRKPHAVIPIALPTLSIVDLEEHALFKSIIRTNGVLYWSDVPTEQNQFWEALEDRLN